MANQTSWTDFVLLEFSAIRELQILHFFLFLVLYLLAVTWNLLIIASVASDRRLHTPMYFFLINLAMQDLGQVSVILPKSMINSLLNTRHISYPGCVAQVLFYVLFAGSYVSLLTVMAYDRYVAICSPLHYDMIMNRAACMQMIVIVWITGIFYSVLHTTGTFAISFCSNIINQFFCEIPQLLTLSCTQLFLIDIIVTVIGGLLALGCFIFVLITYVQIFTAVLKIPSVQGRRKAFSTCIPHLIVFSTFLITGNIAYLRPPSSTPSYMDLVFTIMYSIIPPMLNPIVYSMRNKDIKIALSKLLGLR